MQEPNDAMAQGCRKPGALGRRASKVALPSVLRLTLPETSSRLLIPLNQRFVGLASVLVGLRIY